MICMALTVVSMYVIWSLGWSAVSGSSVLTSSGLPPGSGIYDVIHAHGLFLVPPIQKDQKSFGLDFCSARILKEWFAAGTTQPERFAVMYFM